MFEHTQQGEVHCLFFFFFGSLPLKAAPSFLFYPLLSSSPSMPSSTYPPNIHLPSICPPIYLFTHLLPHPSTHTPTQLLFHGPTHPSLHHFLSVSFVPLPGPNKSTRRIQYCPALEDLRILNHHMSIIEFVVGKFLFPELKPKSASFWASLLLGLLFSLFLLKHIKCTLLLCDCFYLKIVSWSFWILSFFGKSTSFKSFS